MVIIEGATLVNGTQCNIVVKDGLIEEITIDNVVGGDVISIPKGVYVSPGWIDLHSHAFPNFEPYCSHPDNIGYTSGVTTVVDAGSCGADDITDFYELAKECHTRVLAFLNVSSIGLRVRNELTDLSNLSFEKIEHSFQRFPDFLVGLKARMSASVIGENDIKPLKLTMDYASKLKKPVMVHVGSAPPLLSEIAEQLRKGDIITHCFNGKEGNTIIDDDLSIKKAIRDATNRGVYLDVGHGTSSFSFEIAKQAMKGRLPLHSISTDIYEQNRLYGPVYSLATTMTKFLALGYSLEDVVKSVTETPAKILKKPLLGVLKRGAVADLTFFTIEDKNVTLIDSLGNKLDSPIQIKPFAVILGGKYYECI
ncbi:amidohydrolase/deacetylase family metallohydrolase [Ornithinibacillus bavariensis]|uniref:Dihydroorotase n=1 Tax=Ornithinibacillus bavariensis TaxID=545502 RepID=A0A919X8P5_9BACI|nr:amidohydrolase/deacetylase family metallohydrolase [Ornithinibacillus bavariensis]GIO27089.1 dihydroorotase [Ornithinibacillus bavariensis]